MNRKKSIITRLGLVFVQYSLKEMILLKVQFLVSGLSNESRRN